MSKHGNSLILMMVFLLQIAAFVFTSCSGHKNNIEQNLPSWYPETNQTGDSVYEVFGNKLPCFDKGCTKIKFAQAIYRNAPTKLLTTYMMARVYVGRDENGRITNTGDISISKGILSDSNVTVYNLTTGAPGDFKHFWKINDSLLFILDNHLQPRVGDESYGYVLNKTR